jgi:type IV pilus assembly protein PilO
MSDFDLRNLDFNNAGAFPTSVKAFFCVLIVALILLGGWYFFVRDQLAALESLEAREVELKTDFEYKAGKAANLVPLKRQLEEMAVLLQQMLRQLPSRNEMPDLIVDISQTALASGIQNELFQPEAESTKEFYAEQGIKLRMVGTYHQFGAFVSGVASLPRVVIMTMHDISLTPKTANASIGPGNLVLEGTIKTYRYLDDEEKLGDTGLTAGGN